MAKSTTRQLAKRAPFVAHAGPLDVKIADLLLTISFL